MKIVDLDAEIERTCQAVCGCERKDCKWAHFGPNYKPEKACTVIQRLEEAQPIEAITVKWLEKYKDEPMLKKSIHAILYLWRREQEAKT